MGAWCPERGRPRGPGVPQKELGDEAEGLEVEFIRVKKLWVPFQRSPRPYPAACPCSESLGWGSGGGEQSSVWGLSGESPHSSAWARAPHTEGLPCCGP